MKSVLTSTKRFLAVFLALAMVILSVPETAMNVFADETPTRYKQVTNAETGEISYAEDANGEYVLNEDGVTYSLYEEPAASSDPSDPTDPSDPSDPVDPVTPGYVDETYGDTIYPTITFSLNGKTDGTGIGATVTYYSNQGSTEVDAARVNSTTKQYTAASEATDAVYAKVSLANGYTFSGEQQYYTTDPNSKTALTKSGDDYILDLTTTKLAMNYTLVITTAANSYTVTDTNNHENYTFTGATTATHGVAYSFTVEPASGYYVSGVTFTEADGNGGSGNSGGTTLSVGGDGKTYTIEAAKVYNNIAIGVTVVANASENTIKFDYFTPNESTELTTGTVDGLAQIQYAVGSGAYSTLGEMTPAAGGTALTSTKIATGETLKLKITPADSWELVSVKVNSSAALEPKNGEYSYKVTSNGDVVVKIAYKRTTYTVAAGTLGTDTVLRGGEGATAISATANKGDDYVFYVEKPKAGANAEVSIAVGTGASATTLTNSDLTIVDDHSTVYAKVTVQAAQVTGNMVISAKSYYNVTVINDNAETTKATIAAVTESGKLYAGEKLAITVTGDTGYKPAKPKAYTKYGDPAQAEVTAGYIGEDAGATTGKVGAYEITAANMKDNVSADVTLVVETPLTAYNTFKIKTTTANAATITLPAGFDAYDGVEGLAFDGGASAEKTVYTEVTNSTSKDFTIAAKSGYTLGDVTYDTESAETPAKITPSGSTYIVTLAAGKVLTVNVASTPVTAGSVYVNDSAKHITYALANDGAKLKTSKSTGVINTGNNSYGIAAGTGELTLTLTAEAGFEPDITIGDSPAVAMASIASLKLAGTKASGTKTIYTYTIGTYEVQAQTYKWINIAEKTTNTMKNLVISAPTGSLGATPKNKITVSADGVIVASSASATADGKNTETYSIKSGSAVVVTINSLNAGWSFDTKTGASMTGNGQTAAKKLTQKATSFTTSYTMNEATNIALSAVASTTGVITGGNAVLSKGVYTVDAGALTAALTLGNDILATGYSASAPKLKSGTAANWAIANDGTFTIPATAAGSTYTWEVKAGQAAYTFTIAVRAKLSANSMTVKGVAADGKTAVSISGTKGVYTAKQELGTTVTYTLTPAAKEKSADLTGMTLLPAAGNETNVVKGTVTATGAGTATFTVALNGVPNGNENVITVKDAAGTTVATLTIEPQQIVKNSKEPKVTVKAASDNSFTLNLGLTGISQKQINNLNNAGNLYYKIEGTTSAFNNPDTYYVPVTGTTQQYVWTPSHGGGTVDATHGAVAAVKTYTAKVTLIQAASGTAAGRTEPGTIIATSDNPFDSTTKSASVQKTFTTKASGAWTTKLTVSQKVRQIDTYQVADLAIGTVASDAKSAYTNDGDYAISYENNYIGTGQVTASIKDGVLYAKVSAADLDMSVQQKVVKITVTANNNAEYKGTPVSKTISLTVVQKATNNAGLAANPADVTLSKQKNKAATYQITPSFGTLVLSNANKQMTYKVMNYDHTADILEGDPLYKMVTVTNTGKVTVNAKYVIQTAGATKGANEDTFSVVGSLKTDPTQQTVTTFKLISKDSADSVSLGDLVIAKQVGGAGNWTIYRTGETIHPEDIDTSYNKDGTEINVVTLKKGAPALSSYTTAQFAAYRLTDSDDALHISYTNSSKAVATLTGTTLTYLKNGKLNLTATAASTGETVKASFTVGSTPLKANEATESAVTYTISVMDDDGTAHRPYTAAGGATATSKAAPLTYSSATQGTVMLTLMELVQNKADSQWSTRALTTYDDKITVSINTKESTGTAKITRSYPTSGVYIISSTPKAKSTDDSFAIDIINKNKKSNEAGYKTTIYVQNAFYQKNATVATSATATGWMTGAKTAGKVTANYNGTQTVTITATAAAGTYDGMKLTLPSSYSNNKKYYPLWDLVYGTGNNKNYFTNEALVKSTIATGGTLNVTGPVNDVYTYTATTNLTNTRGKLAAGKYTLYLTLGNATGNSTSVTDFTAATKPMEVTLEVAAAPAFTPDKTFNATAYSSTNLDAAIGANDNNWAANKANAATIIKFTGKNLDTNVKLDSVASLVDTKDNTENNFGKYFTVNGNNIELTWAGWEAAQGGSYTEEGYIYYTVDGSTKKNVKAKITVSKKAQVAVNVDASGTLTNTTVSVAVNGVSKDANLTTNKAYNTAEGEKILVTMVTNLATVRPIVTVSTPQTLTSGPVANEAGTEWTWTYEYTVGTSPATLVITQDTNRTYTATLTKITDAAKILTGGTYYKQVQTVDESLSEVKLNQKLTVINGKTLKLQFKPTDANATKAAAATLAVTTDGGETQKLATWNNTTKLWEVTVTMPTKDISIEAIVTSKQDITATFESTEIASVALTTNAGGIGTSTTSGQKFTVNTADLAAGQVVTLTATPKAGYRVESMTAKNSKNGNVVVTKVPGAVPGKDEASFKLTMPTDAVAVAFTCVPVKTITTTPNGATVEYYFGKTAPTASTTWTPLASASNAVKVAGGETYYFKVTAAANTRIKTVTKDGTTPLTATDGVYSVAMPETPADIAIVVEPEDTVDVTLTYDEHVSLKYLENASAIAIDDASTVAAFKAQATDVSVASGGKVTVGKTTPYIHLFLTATSGYQITSVKVGDTEVINTAASYNNGCLKLGQLSADATVTVATTKLVTLEETKSISSSNASATVKYAVDDSETDENSSYGALATTFPTGKILVGKHLGIKVDATEHEVVTVKVGKDETAVPMTWKESKNAWYGDVQVTAAMADNTDKVTVNVTAEKTYTVTVTDASEVTETSGIKYTTTTPTAATAASGIAGSVTAGTAIATVYLKEGETIYLTAAFKAGATGTDVATTSTGATLAKKAYNEIVTTSDDETAVYVVTVGTANVTVAVTATPAG